MRGGVRTRTILRLERETGLEPATACLEGRRSTKLSYSRALSILPRSARNQQSMTSANRMWSCFITKRNTREKKKGSMLWTH